MACEAGGAWLREAGAVRRGRLPPPRAIGGVGRVLRRWRRDPSAPCRAVRVRPWPWPPERGRRSPPSSARCWPCSAAPSRRPVSPEGTGEGVPGAGEERRGAGGVPPVSPRCPLGVPRAPRGWRRWWLRGAGVGVRAARKTQPKSLKNNNKKKAISCTRFARVCPKKERRAQAVPGVQLGSAGRQEGEWLDFGARQNPRFISSSSRASVLAAPGSSCCTVPARALPLPRGFVAPCWGFPPLLEERWL